MAATWTAVGPNSWFYTSWVADMGPYIGPGQFSVDWLPPDAGEIDFYVGVLVGDLSTGDFPGDVLGAYRYRNRGTENSSSSRGDLTLAGPNPHLYAVWWDPAYPSDPAQLVPPNLKPEQVVPCTYVRGGRGPYFGPGQWSDWIDGETVSIQAGHHYDSQGAFDAHTGGEFTYDDRASAPYGTNTYGNTQRFYPYFPDPTQFPPSGDAAFPSGKAELEAKLALLRTYNIAQRYPDLSEVHSPELQLFNEGNNDIGFFLHYEKRYINSNGYHHQQYQASFQYSQLVMTFALPSSVDPNPGSYASAYLASHGITPLSGPNGSPYDVEPGAAQVLGWSDATYRCQYAEAAVQATHWVNTSGYEAIQGQYATTDPIAYPDMPFVVRVIPGLQVYPADNQIDHQDPTVPFVHGNLGSEVARLHAGDAATITLPFSTVDPPPQAFSVVTRPALLTEGDLSALPDFDIPIDPNGQGLMVDFDGHMDPVWFDNNNLTLPTVQYRKPRWRYWIPGPLRCCPNQKLRIIQRASGRWSDWQPPVETVQQADSRETLLMRVQYGAGAISGDYATAVAKARAAHAAASQRLIANEFGTFTADGVDGYVEVYPQANFWGASWGSYAELNYYQAPSHAYAYADILAATITAPDQRHVLPNIIPPGVQGVDWDTSPITGTNVDFDGDSQAMSWDRWHLSTRPYGFEEVGSNSYPSAYPVPTHPAGVTLYESVRVAPAIEVTAHSLGELFNSSLPTTGPQAAWIAARTAGTEVAQITQTTIAARPSEYSDGSSQTVEVDLSAADGATSFTVLFHPMSLTEPLPVPDPPPYADTYPDTSLYGATSFVDIGLHATEDHQQWLSGTTAASSAQLTPRPTLRYTSPRWRYWIPDNVEIPTCVAQQGGHWGIPLGGALLPAQLRKP